MGPIWLSDEQRKEIVDRLEAEGKGFTPNSVLAAARNEAKEEKREDCAVIPSRVVLRRVRAR